MLRRSLLFVPGIATHRFEKAKASGADAILFDLEDSVPPDAKGRAREAVCVALSEGGFERSEAAVRVNAPGTPFHEDDVRATALAGAEAIMVPKSERADDLRAVASILDEVGAGTRILALLETPLGVARALEVGMATPRVDALCFGHADFALEMGVSADDPSKGVLYHARCAVALAARGCGAQPVDNVCLAVRDEEALRRDVHVGMELGYEGKLCIHPSQVTITNEMYTPAREEVDYAQRVLSGWQAARAEGLGVFTLDDKMVDAPLVRAQERVLDRARRAGLISEATS
jgi:citrate lyase subunit beta/citryl-CoA lyase